MLFQVPTLDQKQKGKDAQVDRMAAVPANPAQKQKGNDADRAEDFLVQDEKSRVFLTSMVCCLFAREVYKEAVLADCLNAVGYRSLAENRGLRGGEDPENAVANAD